MYKTGFKNRFPLNTCSNNVQTKNKPMNEQKIPSAMNVFKRKGFLCAFLSESALTCKI